MRLAVHIQKKSSWQLLDSAVTPESQYLGRRQFLRTFGLGLAAGAFLPKVARSATSGFPDVLNVSYKLSGSKLTPYDDITSYNNFYEGGWRKAIPKSMPTAVGRRSLGRSRLAVHALNPANMTSTT